MTNSYTPIYSKIQSQRQTLESNILTRGKQSQMLRGQIKESRRHRLRTPAPQVQLRAGRYEKKGKRQISELQTQMKEEKKTISEMEKQEAQIKEYEQEGYEAEQAGDEYRFTKEVMVERLVEQPRTKHPEAVITWQDKRGKRHVQTVRWEHRENVLGSVRATGGTVLDVAHSPGGYQPAVRKYMKEVHKEELPVIKGPGYAIHPTTYGQDIKEGLKLAQVKEAKAFEVAIGKESPQLSYLIKYADTKESKRLKESLYDTEEKFAKASELAYVSLTPKEKEVYGYKYKPFLEEPVSEWKFYPGGKKHLELLPTKEREKLVESFLKEHKIEHDPWYAFGSTWRVDDRPIEGLRTKGLKDIEIKEKIAWEELTKTPTEIKHELFAKLPTSGKIMASFGESGIHAVLWKVTVPQMIVKYATGKGEMGDVIGRIQTGKPLIFPDISKRLGEKAIAPPSKIGTELQKHLFKKDVSAIEQYQVRYPLSTTLATAGDIAGLWLGGKGIRHIYGVPTKIGIKYSIRSLPKMYDKISSYTGTRFTYLTGGRFAPAKTFGSRIGQTKFYQNLYSWAKGEKIFVKSYPAVKGYPKTFRVGERFARIWKYKGFGRRELISPKEVPIIGKSGKGFLRFGAGPKSEFRMIFEDVTVKGLFRKRITQKYASTGITLWEKGETVPYYIKGTSQVPYVAVKKAPVISKGFIASKDAYGALVRQTYARPMMGGRMHHAGYVSDASISIPTSMLGKSYLSTSALALMSRMDVKTKLMQETEKSLVSLGRQERVSLQRLDSLQRQVQPSQQGLISLQGMEQIQLQLQQQEYKFKQILQRVPTRIKPVTHRVPSYVPARFLVPFFWLDGGVDRKKKRRLKPFDWEKHHREFEWDVPGLEIYFRKKRR